MQQSITVLSSLSFVGNLYKATNPNSAAVKLRTLALLAQYGIFGTEKGYLQEFPVRASHKLAHQVL